MLLGAFSLIGRCVCHIFVKLMTGEGGHEGKEEGGEFPHLDPAIEVLAYQINDGLWPL